MLNPVANIKVGALILKDYITRFGGVEPALKAYSGAALTEEDYGYALKVLGERDRIRAAAGPVAKPVRATTAAAVATPAAPKLLSHPAPGKIDET